MKYLREHILPRVTFLTFLVFLVDILTNLSQLVDAMDAYWDYQGEWHLGLCLCHPLAILGQNNRNNCDYYYRNYLALPSSTSSPTGYIGTEQSQLSQQSCFIIIVIIIWLHWDRTITIIAIILPYHRLFSIIIRQ